MQAKGAKIGINGQTQRQLQALDHNEAGAIGRAVALAVVANYLVAEQAGAMGAEGVAIFDRALLGEPGFFSPNSSH